MLLCALALLAGLLWWQWPTLQPTLAGFLSRWLPTALLWLALLGLLLLIGAALALLARHWQRQRAQQALRQLYARRQTLRSLQAMDPLAFEQYVGGMFALLGYRVTFTPHSGDEGVDLWLTWPDGQRLPVQCKRYADAYRIGSPALQTFSGAMRRALVMEGYFVTTSSFTPAARAWARAEGIHLIDGPDLLAWQQRLSQAAGETRAHAATTLPVFPRAISVKGGNTDRRTMDQWPEQL